MTVSKIAIVLIGASLAAAPAFAQSTGTPATGTEGTAAQPSKGTAMKGSNTMMKSQSGAMTKAPMAGDKSTTTGGPSGGRPSKN